MAQQFSGGSGRVVNEDAPPSDHSALILILGHKEVQRKGRFRFENAWICEEECRALILQSWNQGSNVDLQDRIDMCGVSVHAWGSAHRRMFRDQLASCRTRIKELNFRVDTEANSRVREARLELNRLLAQQESHWRQRAKQFWLATGDKNTRFFCSFASARKRKNEVAQLLIVDYFKDIFTSRGSDSAEILSIVNREITEEQNQYLPRPFEAKEVREAVFSMHPHKSPRSDGMNTGIFQAYWDIVGEEVTRTCMKCLNDCQLPEGMNSTLIVLIPKKSRQERISDLRPISLCNVVYKIMAKVLANRLKEVLQSVISESQSPR